MRVFFVVAVLLLVSFTSYLGKDNAFRNLCVSIDGSDNLSAALSLRGYCTIYDHAGNIYSRPCSWSSIRLQNRYFASCPSHGVLCLEAYNRAQANPSNQVYGHDALIVRQRKGGKMWICRVTPSGSSIRTHAIWINGD